MAAKRSGEGDDGSDSGSPGVRSTGKQRLSAQGKPVTVIAGRGDSTVEFFLPESLLTQHSDFAKAALSGSWAEAEKRIIALPEQDAEVVDIFATFVYSGKVYSAREGDLFDADGRKDKEWTRLGKCWLLGDMLQSTSFRDATADALVQKTVDDDKIPAGMQRIVYEETVGDNALKKLVVDIAALVWTESIFERVRLDRKTPVEFLVDVCLRLRKRTQGEGDPLSNCGCKYHEHGTEKPCYKTMF